MATNYYDPKTLRGVIRKVEPVRTFFKSRFFAESVTFPTSTVSFEFYANKKRLAPYQNDRLPSEALNRDGYEVRTYQTPLLSPSRVISNDTLAMKLLGEQPYNSGISPDERAAQIAANDLNELLDSISRREEYMCARAKQDGKLTISGRGLNQVVDYGFTNIETCTQADQWTSSYDVIAKLKSKAAELRKNGAKPSMLILGTDAADALLENNKVVKLLDLRSVDVGEIRPQELEDGIEYIGKLSMPGLFVDIYSYNEYYFDSETGDSYPYLDPDCAILQDARESNMMLYGAVTYIDDKTREYVTEMNEFVPQTWAEINPPVKHISVSSRPLPMPQDINGWAVLKDVC